MVLFSKGKYAVVDWIRLLVFCMVYTCSVIRRMESYSAGKLACRGVRVSRRVTERVRVYFIWVRMRSSSVFS